jgi:hypothetical protein
MMRRSKKLSALQALIRKRSERNALRGAAERRARDGADSLADLAARIRAEHEARLLCVKRGFAHAIAAGTLLIEAKRQLDEHGSWLPWLKEYCQIPERTAQHYMWLARNAPEVEAKSATLADLTMREAIELLKRSSANDGAVLPLPLVEEWRATAPDPVAAACVSNPVARAWQGASPTERREFATLFYAEVARHAQQERKSKGRAESPTFIARFADGETIRMTVATPLDALDVRRGVKLARQAYESRCKRALSFGRRPTLCCKCCKPRPRA